MSHFKELDKQLKENVERLINRTLLKDGNQENAEIVYKALNSLERLLIKEAEKDD